MNLVNKINKEKIPEGSIGIWWLGQAGFIIKMPGGIEVTIDAYLSNCCERELREAPVAINDFKRIAPSLIKAEELKTNLIIASHNHCDHFDIDSIPTVMENSSVKLAGPDSVIKESIKLGIGKDKLILLEEGKEIKFEKFTLLPVYADHGDLAPDALGFILNFGNFKLYFTGDTAYRVEKMGLAINNKPEIIMLPINGKFGNLNPAEAAKLANDVKAKVAIPCHYWTFIEHGGDPLSFYEALKKYAPDCKCSILTQGEGFIYPK